MVINCRRMVEIWYWRCYQWSSQVRIGTKCLRCSHH